MQPYYYKSFTGDGEFAKASKKPMYESDVSQADNFLANSRVTALQGLTVTPPNESRPVTSSSKSRPPTPQAINQVAHEIANLLLEEAINEYSSIRLIFDRVIWQINPKSLHELENIISNSEEELCFKGQGQAKLDIVKDISEQILQELLENFSF